MVEPQIVPSAGALSLIPMTVPFIVVTRLTVKAKLIRSLQFQVLVFTLILVASETPSVLEAVKMIGATPYRLLVDGIHAASMVLAFSFIYQWRDPSHKVGDEFSGLLQSAIDAGLVSFFGENTAKSVKFYVDTSIALRDPDAYVKFLKGIFREGTTLIVRFLCDQICEKVGLEKRAWSSLGECVKSARNFYKNRSIDNLSSEGQRDGRLGKAQTPTKSMKGLQDP